MPPFTPNRSQPAGQPSPTDDNQEQESTTPPTISDPTERGPAARQLGFVAERLVGAPESSSAPPQDDAPQTDTIEVNEGSGDITLAVPEGIPRSMALSVVQSQTNLAVERRAQLTNFRTRQMVQTQEAIALAESTGILPEASRDIALSTATASSETSTVTDFVETNRWLLLGPSVVREGQSGKQSAMSGRVRGIAVAPGGERLYIATANGGVWRSEDGGRSWLSLMDAFDLNPSLYRADSLACGALALVPGQWAGEDIIYVGSGEPGVSPWFQGDSAYFGVGPIVSTDGGLNWITEPSEPTLAGSAFYALAVNPLRPQQVVAATLEGLYRRERDTQGNFHWMQKKAGHFSSVVVSHQNQYVVFYAADWGGGVWQSRDGNEWKPMGTDFPVEGVGRIGLAVQPDNPDILYALIANTMDHLLGLYRLDCADEQWRLVHDIPATLFGPDLTYQGQGGYDLAVTVDPVDVNRVYVGGSIVYSDGLQAVDQFAGTPGDWSGSLYRCEIEIDPTTQTVSARPTYIGGAVHGDIHTLAHAPADSDRLWVGCDGGIFYSNAPRANPLAVPHSRGLFSSCNTGLSTLTMNYLGMHPTEEALLFCGTQDNGGLRYTGDPVWLYSSGGDSGHFVINWNNPYEVVTTYVQNQIFRSLDGGMRYSYDAIHVLGASPEPVQFYAPLAGTPYAPNEPETATRIAFGGKRVWLSDHFGGDGIWWNGNTWVGEVDWVSLPNNDPATDNVDGVVESLTFATASILYAGTTAGRIYRYTDNGSHWQRAQLPAIANDEVAAYVGTISSIAADPADATHSAIYVTLGGYENPHRVWYFDGVRWEPRSGPMPAPTANSVDALTGMAQERLLNVQHNAIVVDPQMPSHLYVAADIGVWRSLDSGHSWHVFARGLPDAAVIDLKLQTESRLLRAATHGRGVYEFDLGRPQRPVDLYIRDHALDLGRHPAVSGLPDPTRYGASVAPGQSPDIRLDPPDAAGRYQTFGPHPRQVQPFSMGGHARKEIDFYTFATQLDADTNHLVTHSRSNIQTPVYVQVHNRGMHTANTVQVTLLLATLRAQSDTTTAAAPPPSPLPPLPTGYEAAIHAGQPIASEQWQTIGQVTVHGVRPGYPQIATFVVDANALPTPGRLRDDRGFALVAIIHCVDDPFVAESIVTSDEEPGGSVTINPANNRHIAHRLVQVTPFRGTLPVGLERRRPLQLRSKHLLAEHRVQRGETLSHIAKHYYDSAHNWPLIYRANRQAIGPNPDRLRTGINLKIPRL